MKANRTHTRLSLAATTCQKQQVKICQTALLDYSKGTDILLQLLSVQVAEKKMFPLIKGNSHSMSLNVGFSLHPMSVVHAHQRQSLLMQLFLK